MWKQICQKLIGAISLCELYYKQWSKFGRTQGRAFFLLGFVVSFPFLVGLASIFEPFWANLSSGEMLFYEWGGHAIRMSYQLMIVASGLVAAYLHPRLANKASLPVSFEELARSIPRQAWRLFFVFSLATTMLFLISIHGYYLRVSGQGGSNMMVNYTGEQALMPWLYSIADVVYSLMPYPMAGILYLKASRLANSALYKSSFWTLIAAGFAVNAIISVFLTYVKRLILQPLFTMVQHISFNFVISNALEAIIHINVFLIMVFLVRSAFTEKEEKFDFEPAEPESSLSA